MSDTPALHPSNGSVQPPRPVSLFTIVFLLAVFAAFLLVIRYFYEPAAAPAFVGTPENLPKELEWRSDRASRAKALHELREAESGKLATYGWVDQNAKVVHLPIDRAIELTARDLTAKQPKRQPAAGAATKQ
jgi:hypothetical protein